MNGPAHAEGVSNDKHGENYLSGKKKSGLPSDRGAAEPEGVEKYKRIIFAATLGVAFVIGSTLLTGWITSGGCWLTAHPKIQSGLQQFSEIVDKLGDALLIAAIIGYSIDVAIKHDLIEEVVRAASPELLGRHLPPNVHRALQGMFEIRFVRTEWIVEYVLSEVPGQAGLLKVEETIEGVIQNFGKTQQPYTLITSVDPSLLQGHLESEITRLNVAPESGASLTDGKPTNQVKEDKTKVASYSFDIAPGARYKTKVVLIEYRPTSFILPLFTGTTVAKTVVKIRYPKGKLDLHVSTGTSDSLEAKTETDLGKEWEITEPLLPGHCVITRWLPTA